MTTSFDKHGESFWQKDGPYRTLHHINPVRLNFIQHYINPSNQTILDVGCGGGILSEGLAALGAKVTGIDISESVLLAAKNHLATTDFDINYLQTTTKELISQNQQFDHITCLEMLEHLDDPYSIIKDLFLLVKDGGYVFLSTINRTIKSYLGAIVFAEKISGLIPKGTHNHNQFIKPAELINMCEKAGFNITGISGMKYFPLTKSAKLSNNLAINYLLALKK